MNVRDATSDDEAALGALADGDVDPARLVRDRTVRVAETDDGVVGFVAFDAYRDAVHVTRLDGDPEAVETLLGEPCSFAASECVPVEAVLLDPEDAIQETLSRAGFEDVGPGPRFDGQQSRRYRRETSAE
jgi:hypothetical protein